MALFKQSTLPGCFPFPARQPHEIPDAPSLSLLASSGAAGGRGQFLPASPRAPSSISSTTSGPSSVTSKKSGTGAGTSGPTSGAGRLEGRFSFPSMTVAGRLTWAADMLRRVELSEGSRGRHAAASRLPPPAIFQVRRSYRTGLRTIKTEPGVVRGVSVSCLAIQACSIVHWSEDPKIQVGAHVSFGSDVHCVFQ